MVRRLGWIVASYFTRPLVLLLFGVGILLACIGWFDRPPRPRNNAPQFPSVQLLVDSQATLDAVLREGRQDDVHAINLHALWGDMNRRPEPRDIRRAPAVDEFKIPGKEFFDIVKQFPNLRSVRMTFYGRDQGVDQLAEVPHLEYLAISGTAPADFSWMRSLKKLRWLEMTLYGPRKGVDGLRVAPKLETVVFRSRSNVSDEVLAAMAALPHLRQLVLDFHSTVSSVATPPLTEAGFAALGRSKSLRTLYVGSLSPPDQQELVALATGALPRMHVEPVRVVRRRHVLLYLQPFIWLAVAIGFALASQFRSPLSRLAPGFVSGQVLVGGVLLAAIVMAAAATLIRSGFDPLASIVVSVAFLAAMVYMASFYSVAAPGDVRRQQTGSLLRTLLLFGVIGPLLLPQLGNVILWGSYPWVLAFMGLMAIVAIGLTIRELRRLVKTNADAGYLDRHGTRLQTLMRTQYAAGWWFAFARREQQIEAWQRDHPRWTWWHRVIRWRVGNAPFKRVSFMLIVTGSYLGFMYVFQTISVAGSAWPAPDFGELRRLLLAPIAILLMAATAQVVMAWRARMLTLGVESLRPVARRDLQNEMAAAFILDLTPPALVSAATLAIAIDPDSALQQDWARAAIDFLMATVAILAMAAGLGAIVVVIKRDWVALALVPMIIGLLAVMAVGATTLLATPNEWLHGLAPRTIELQLGVAIVIGGVLGTVMRQRFMKMEIGSRA